MGSYVRLMGCINLSGLCTCQEQGLTRNNTSQQQALHPSFRVDQGTVYYPFEVTAESLYETCIEAFKHHNNSSTLKVHPRLNETYMLQTDRRSPSFRSRSWSVVRCKTKQFVDFNYKMQAKKSPYLLVYSRSVSSTREDSQTRQQLES